MKTDMVLIKPVLTEKATGLTKNGVYTFEVAMKATKPQIKSAIQSLYEVKVAKIATVVRKGKVKKVGRRLVPKKRSAHKIAFIKMKSGSIDLFPKT